MQHRILRSERVQDSDALWKTLTARANSAFAEKRWYEAEALYLEALAEADALFRAYSEETPYSIAESVPMLVAATANIAECWLRCGQPRRAGDHLIVLCRRLCEVVEREGGREDIRQCCFMHLRTAVFELADKLARAGFSREQTTSEIEYAKFIALNFLIRNTHSQ